jgi:hypothetical protein
LTTQMSTAAMVSVLAITVRSSRVDHRAPGMPEPCRSRSGVDQDPALINEEERISRSLRRGRGGHAGPAGLR